MSLVNLYRSFSEEQDASWHRATFPLCFVSLLLNVELISPLSTLHAFSGLARSACPPFSRQGCTQTPLIPIRCYFRTPNLTIMTFIVDGQLHILGHRLGEVPKSGLFVMDGREV
jgi:hypothetical protein